ncbi:GGDEF domain-containing protein [Herbaspirillum lusitanum]|uniref:diguanylate cyclase n=1 Tax=Herbaspirillum lusitanum TaxID=213312 RepID=A0ABW9ACX0_9BURK
MNNDINLIAADGISRRQTAFAWTIIALLLLLLVIITPYAQLPLTPIPGYIGAFGVAMFVVNIILASLLFSKGIIENSARTVHLGTAYFFVTAIFVPLIASFPGSFMPGSLIGNSVSPVWIWCYWHVGFAVLVIRYATSGKRAIRIRASIAFTLATVILLTMSATVWQRWMPDILQNGSSFFEDNTFLIPVTVLGVNLLALICVARMEKQEPEQLWITVAMVAACIDVWLTVYGNTRFSLGWYFAKLTSLFTSLTVLISQLYGITRLYNSIASANKVLLTLANQDGLTSLTNRRCFDEILEIEWNRARRDKRSLGLLMIDVDFFKKYNDEYGHLQGDDCLRRVAEHLIGVIKRPGDVAARYGGEEFAIILPNTDAAGAIQVAERLQRNLRTSAITHRRNQPLPIVTLSIGIACATPGGDALLEQLSARADSALYAAKNNGRNQYRVALTTQSINSDHLPLSAI